MGKFVRSGAENGLCGQGNLQNDEVDNDFVEVLILLPS